MEELKHTSDGKLVSLNPLKVEGTRVRSKGHTTRQGTIKLNRRGRNPPDGTAFVRWENGPYKGRTYYHAIYDLEVINE